MYICIDLGGSNIRGTWMDKSGSWGQVTSLSRPRDLEGTKQALNQLIRELINQSGQGVEDIGLASAGPLNLSQGIYLNPTNMPELKGFDVCGFLAGQFGVQPVLENDAQAAALGETYLGALSGERSALVFTLGTGLGSGVILGGKIWRGDLDAGPELGHIYLGPGRKKRCGCGQVGCAETWLNARALKDLAGQNQLLIGDLLELDQHLEQKNPGAVQALEQYGKRLGLYLSQMISVFGIKNIGLSGGISRLFPYFSLGIWDSLRFRLAHRPWLIPEKIEPSPDPQMSALWGMACLILDRKNTAG